MSNKLVLKSTTSTSLNDRFSKLMKNRPDDSSRVNEAPLSLGSRFLNFSQNKKFYTLTPLIKKIPKHGPTYSANIVITQIEKAQYSRHEITILFGTVLLNSENTFFAPFEGVICPFWVLFAPLWVLF